MRKMKDGSRLPWELVRGACGSPDLWRLEVPGGWLVTFAPAGAAGDVIGNPTFLPDPKHEWDHHWCLDASTVVK